MRKIADSIIKTKVNAAGKISKNPWEQYTFVSKVRINGRTKVMIKNVKTHDVVESQYSDLVNAKKNPFNLKIYLPDEYIAFSVNQMGRKQKKSEQFRFVKITGYESNIQFIKIQNISTKKSIITSYDTIMYKKSNPFHTHQDRHEEKVVHPIVSSYLKELGLKQISHERHLTKRSRPDFVFETKSKRIIIIEVKSDKKNWSSTQITSQTKKYQTDAKKVFGNKYSKTYFVSPKGTQGCFSLKDMKLILKQDGAI